jgi:hypothetical protein
MRLWHWITGFFFPVALSLGQLWAEMGAARLCCSNQPAPALTILSSNTKRAIFTLVNRMA